MVKIEHYLEVVYGHGLYRNVGAEVIQNHVNAEGQTAVSECECGHNNKCWVLQTLSLLFC